MSKETAKTQPRVGGKFASASTLGYAAGSPLKSDGVPIVARVAELNDLDKRLLATLDRASGLSAKLRGVPALAGARVGVEEADRRSISDQIGDAADSIASLIDALDGELDMIDKAIG